MKKWLQELAKLSAFAAGVYVALRVIPAEGWYIATAIAIVWLFSLSKQIERMVTVPAVSQDRSASVHLAMPPPLRAKYTFMLRLDPDKMSERLQLTPDEQTAFQRCERWPRAIQVDQWGELLRWRFCVYGQDAAAGEWDVAGDALRARITFWEADLESGKGLIGPKLVLDWAEDQVRLYAQGGRFNTREHYAPDASIDHTTVLMAVSFPDMNQHARASYRDVEHYEFMETYGWEFPGLEEDAEHYHRKGDGVEWWATLSDYRPHVSGKIIKRRIVEKHIIPEWRRQFLVEIMNSPAGQRFWVPSSKIEPDKNGGMQPPDGATVFVTLALTNEGEIEVARIRPYGDVYGAKP
jgi:hypothetical protein